MKNIFLSLLFTSFSLVSFGQTAIPEFKNKVMVLTKNNTLESLESTTLEYSVKGKFGGAKGYLQADDEASKVVYDPKAGSSFIVKLESGVDPESVITLYIFDVAKGMRRIKTGEIGMTGSKKIEIPIIRLDFKKVQDAVYIINTGILPPGEYIYMVNKPVNTTATSDYKGFAFSVAEK